MGIGDWLMAAGEARAHHAKTGRKVMITDRLGKPQWSEVFDHNPYILRTNTFGVDRILNCGGHRPYIIGKSATLWTWRAYKPKPAELFFTDAEMSFAEPYRGAVMVEPNVKENGHKNKAWTWLKWQAVVWSLKAQGHRVVQCAPPGAKLLADVEPVTTTTFRAAAVVQRAARLFIGTEGGLHHAAAANNTPAIVLWSEFISPEVTGYASQTNIRHAGKPCGRRLNCSGCQRSMDTITSLEVLDAAERMLK